MTDNYYAQKARVIQMVDCEVTKAFKAAKPDAETVSVFEAFMKIQAVLPMDRVILKRMELHAQRSKNWQFDAGAITYIRKN